VSHAVKPFVGVCKGLLVSVLTSAMFMNSFTSFSASSRSRSTLTNRVKGVPLLSEGLDLEFPAPLRHWLQTSAVSFAGLGLKPHRGNPVLQNRSMDSDGTNTQVATHNDVQLWRRGGRVPSHKSMPPWRFPLQTIFKYFSRKWSESLGDSNHGSAHLNPKLPALNGGLVFQKLPSDDAFDSNDRRQRW
jgi:hypothetical protein